MEQSDTDKLKSMVRKIYQNYGIDIQSLQDDELVDVYSFYTSNPKNLEKDLERSEKFRDKNPDVDLI